MNKPLTRTENVPNPYDEEPVFYCADCLSLRIRHVKTLDNSEYCDECGSTDVRQANIEEWKKLYKARYGHDYLETF